MNATLGRTTLGALAAAAAALGLAACGGGSSSSAPATAGGATTVSVRTIGGAGSVLVAPDGDALYVNDHGAGAAAGMVACTGRCTSIWSPLTLPAGTTAPKAPASIAGRLGTVRRPGGTRQVTWNGKPLFTFVEDGGPGKVTGDGATDRFGGTTFHWHVAAVGKAASSAGTKTTPQSNGGSGSGY